MSKKLRHLTCNYPFVNCQRNYRAPGTYVNNDNANCKICEDGTQTKKLVLPRKAGMLSFAYESRNY